MPGMSDTEGMWIRARTYVATANPLSLYLTALAIGTPWILTARLVVAAH